MAKTMRALKIDGIGKASVHDDVPIPKLPPDYILVKTKAVALNPTDWKHIRFAYDSPPGPTLGCDFSGVVEEVGPAVTKPWKKGDRVAGFVHGANIVQPDNGAFGEYVRAKGDVQVKISDKLSWEDAATVGVAIITVGLGLYQFLGLPLPTEPTMESFPILIYGGSTATGAVAVQFAKMSGLEVITTSSPRNFEYLKSLGADAVFDYSDSECGPKIREYTKNKLFYAFDCYSEGPSPKICCDALSSEPRADGKKPIWSPILPAEPTRDDIDHGMILGYTIFGEAFKFGRGREYPAIPSDFEFGRNWVPIAEKLLLDGKWKPHRADVRSGGLDGILDGLEDLKNGKVSGHKVVYRVD